MSEIKLFKLDHDAVMKGLEEYAKRCVAKGALAVILIGSLARGNYTAFSDADVIIIVRESEKKPFDRVVDFIDSIGMVEIEPRVYTLEEVREMLRKKVRIIKEIKDYGVLLGGAEKIYEEIVHTHEPE